MWHIRDKCENVNVAYESRGGDMQQVSAIIIRQKIIT